MKKLIAIINADADSKLPKIIGHYEPGYMYGNPKIHKNSTNPPLRPIVSQVGTATYSTAKWINSIIIPYLPKHFQIDSTYDFIEISRTIVEPKMLASLDVENLFTNVPVAETIQIILDNVYQHSVLPPPRHVPRVIMEQLLLICTTKTPFRTPNGELYVQCDGVSMGSPLGPTLANFYMCDLENITFSNNPSLKPPVYCRYHVVKNISSQDSSDVSLCVAVYSPFSVSQQRDSLSVCFG